MHFFQKMTRDVLRKLFVNYLSRTSCNPDGLLSYSLIHDFYHTSCKDKEYVNSGGTDCFFVELSSLLNTVTSVSSGYIFRNITGSLELSMIFPYLMVVVYCFKDSVL